MKIFSKNILLYLFTLSKCEDLSIVCIASCVVYNDGVEYREIYEKNWLVPNKLNFGENKLIAISVTKDSSGGGLMITSSPEGSYDTDAQRWRCSPSVDAQPTWNDKSFDDAVWPKAEFIGFNGDCKYNPNFFSRCVEMSEFAAWIWHPSPTSQKFYCRMDVAKEGKGLNLGQLPDRKMRPITTEKYELAVKSSLVFSVLLSGLAGLILIAIIINRMFCGEEETSSVE